MLTSCDSFATFYGLHDELCLAIEYLSDLLNVQQEEFHEFMMNCFLSYIALPLCQKLISNISPLFALYLLLRKLQNAEALHALKVLILSQNLPRGLTEKPVKPPEFATTYSGEPLFALAKSNSRHLELVYDRIISDKVDRANAAPSVMDISTIGDALNKLNIRDNDKKFHQELSKGTGVITNLLNEADYETFASNAPFAFYEAMTKRDRKKAIRKRRSVSPIAQHRGALSPNREDPFSKMAASCPNPTSIVIFDYIHSSPAPNVEALQFLLTLLDDASVNQIEGSPGYIDLNYFCSENFQRHLIKSIQTLQSKMHPCRMSIQKLFEFFSLMQRVLPANSSVITRLLKECVDPVIKFFIGYELDSGLSRLSIYLEEAFLSEDFKFDVDNLHYTAAIFRFAAPTGLLEESLAYKEKPDSLPLRAHVWLLKKYIKMFETAYPS